MYPRFVVSISPWVVLSKAAFLIALATGLRISQLGALPRAPGMLGYGPSDSLVSLAPRSDFLAKNARSGHVLGPVVVPA